MNTQYRIVMINRLSKGKYYSTSFDSLHLSQDHAILTIKKIGEAISKNIKTSDLTEWQAHPNRASLPENFIYHICVHDTYFYEDISNLYVYPVEYEYKKNIGNVYKYRGSRLIAREDDGMIDISLNGLALGTVFNLPEALATVDGIIFACRLQDPEEEVTNYEQ